MSETWRDIKGYEGYYKISNIGTIKSLDRTVVTMLGVTRNLKGKILSVSLDKDGYKIAVLYKDGNGKNVKSHRLVAKSFIQNYDNKKEVNHKNAIKTDNRVENLEWCSNKENIRHATKLGLQTKGEQRSIYTEKQILKVIEMLNKRIKHKDINKETGVSLCTISDVKRKARWTYLAHLLVV